MDSTALPTELLTEPKPLIGFCGLDVEKNPVHKAVWDAFVNNRKSERAVVQFKMLPSNYDFPVAKPKRTSYEWYHPKGIMKRNWMLKHLHVLPSVVVVFFEVEWNDVQWTEKQLQCASTLQALKNSLHDRNTRICLVLLQSANQLPPGEDMLASERASSITSTCGINSKMLFILPYSEHLMGYTLRLESAFLDMAHSYYGLMAKRIRTHRDQLTAAHTSLKIRHQFKLGFVSEIRLDFSTALKHYTQSYATLDEIKMTDTNCLEIKTIAGFLNYKICRLMFKLKVPRDAINHFITHVEKYKNRNGCKDLLFEHYAWLSTQHSVFAELFCEAIKNGLPALQTQHPGIYHHKAAEYISKRREAFLAGAALLSPSDTSMPNAMVPGVTASSLQTEYFGIRTVKAGEPIAEHHVTLIIRDAEKTFNHSNTIINLLGQAMAQFKIYKCLRFRKKLAIDMAEEYLKNGDHSKALTLYSLMLPDYRHEKWCSVFSNVLLKTLRCAFLSASVSDYISCSLEALSPNIRNEQKERIIVLENLWKVFQGVPPISQCQNAPEIRELWEEKLNTTSGSIPIDLDNLSQLFELYTTFDKKEVKANEIIRINLIIRILTDVPLKMRTFILTLSDCKNSYRLEAKKFAKFSNVVNLRKENPDDNTIDIQHFSNLEGDIKLEPQNFYQLLFTTEAQQFLENTQLHVIRIEMKMGSEELFAHLSKNAIFTRNAFRHYNRLRDVDDNIVLNPMCYISPTFHLNTHNNLDSDILLVNEYFPVVTTVSNPHNVFLQNVGMSISVPTHLRSKVFLTTDVLSGRQKLHSQIQLDIGDLSMQSSNTAPFYIFSLADVPIDLLQKVSYTIEVAQRPNSLNAVEATTPTSSENSPTNAMSALLSAMDAPRASSPIQIEFLDDTRLRKTREETISLKSCLDFKFTARFYTLSKKPLSKIFKGENFLIRANIDVQSCTDIDILETYFICDHNLVQSPYSFKRKKLTNTYSNGNQFEDVIVLRANACYEDWIAAKDFERIKPDPQINVFQRLHRPGKPSGALQLANNKPENVVLNSTKNLLGKISNSMSIISGANISSSTISDDDAKTLPLNNNCIAVKSDQTEVTGQSRSRESRIVFNKAVEAVQATGHYRGFIKGVVTCDKMQNNTVFGLYCIKWRRHEKTDENESKFVITGLDIENPPLNIYCSIEEKMFVKMPMTFKIVLKNSSSRVLHLSTVLTISNSDNFICSGHKQLDISIFAYGEKELIYNLYPLCVGWQNLPELSLEYNTHADPNRDESHNTLLTELVQRSIPKKVFVLPPLKQRPKY